MGNQPARPNLTSHSVGNWHWDTATDVINLTVKQETGSDQQIVYALNVSIPFGHGICREDIRIMTKDGVLTVYGRKPVDKEIPSKTLKDLFAKYPHYTSFERNLQLPNFLDTSTIEPRWVHDGLLEIRIKKRGGDQENQVEIAEMPTLTDPRYNTPMIKQDYKVLRSDSEEEEEVKEEKKQIQVEEKVEEIDADKAKPPQTVILPGAKLKDEKKKQPEKEEPKQPQPEKPAVVRGKPDDKTVEKGKATDKEKTKSKKKVSKDQGAKKGKK